MITSIFYDTRPTEAQLKSDCAEIGKTSYLYQVPDGFILHKKKWGESDGHKLIKVVRQ